MFPGPLLLLLLAAASCVNSEELTQPVSMTVQPGQTLTITCKVSYSVTSYGTGWIRQLAGKTLEWVGYTSYTGSLSYKDSLKPKFTMTRDTSSSTLTLKGQSLQPEDTAVYYCARNNGYFDYWGKGTQVTVTSAQSTAPTVFPLAQCGSGTGDLLTLGCLATGFTPASVTFKWTDPNSNAIDSLQYPAVQTGGNYMAVSQVKVNKQDWDAMKTFTCAVEHSAGNAEREITRILPPTKKPDYLQAPSLFIMTPSKEENQTASFACVARDFSPEQPHTIRWIRKGKGITGAPLYEFSTITEKGKAGDNPLYSATSYLQVKESEWIDQNAEFTCIFEHITGNLTKYVKYSSPDGPSACAGVKIEIIPPTVEDLFLHNEDKTVELACHVREDENSPGFLNITWKDEDDKPLASVRDKSRETEHLFIDKLRIPYQEWVNQAEFTCEVEHTSFFGSPEMKTYKRAAKPKTSGVWKRPSIFLLAPAEQTSSDTATLTCYAKDFYPKEILVRWLVNDTVVLKNSDFQFYTTSTISTDDSSSFSVYSQLTMSASDWHANEGVYSCVVYHEYIEETKILVRTMDRTSNKPSLVNLSLNIPQTCRAQ